MTDGSDLALDESAEDAHLYGALWVILLWPVALPYLALRAAWEFATDEEFEERYRELRAERDARRGASRSLTER